MAKRERYSLGPDVPEAETLRDSAGRTVDDAYVDAAVEDALARVRGKGRPSLSDSGESPLLRVRLPRELDQAIRRAAADAGESRSDWVRHVLDEAVRRAG
jgi:predicted HicB family RNase H-like nuclease